MKCVQWRHIRFLTLIGRNKRVCGRVSLFGYYLTIKEFAWDLVDILSYFKRKTTRETTGYQVKLNLQGLYELLQHGTNDKFFSLFTDLLTQIGNWTNLQFNRNPKMFNNLQLIKVKSCVFFFSFFMLTNVFQFSVYGELILVTVKSDPIVEEISPDIYFH